MKRKKNKKRLLIWTLAVLLVGVAGLYVGGSYVIRYRAMHRRADGIAASKAGEHAKAAELLARYLHRYPRDVEALGYYANSREKAELPNGQHFAETINALKVLIGIDPDRLDNQRHLLELYAKLERGPEALDTANAILKNLERKKLPPDERTLQLKTEVLQRLRRDREALETANAWVAAAPQSLHAQMARLSLQADLKASPESIMADARKLLDAHPDDPQMQLLMGFACVKTGDLTQAADWLKKAEAHPKLSDEFVEALVGQYDAIGQSMHSIDVLQRHANEGGGAELRHALAKRYWQVGKWQPAADAMADVKPEDPSADSTLLALKAIALANTKHPDESKACRTALEQRLQPTAAAWALLLKSIVDGAAPDDKAVVAACRSALANDAQNPFLLFYFADANARIGELDTALAAMRRASFGDPTWSLPAVRLVDLLLQKGRPELALAVANTSFRVNMNSAASAIAVARAWSANVDTGAVGNEDQLFKLVNDVQKELPRDLEVRLIQAKLLARRNQKADAAKLVRDTIALSPAPPEGMFLALAALSHRYDLGVDGDCYAASEKAHGATGPLALAEATARYESSSGQAAEGLKVFDQLASRAKDSNTLAWRLARARYLDLANDPGAKAAWVALRDAFPQDGAVQQAVANGRSVQGDWAVLQPAIDHLHALTGDRAIAWRVAQAKLMLDAPRSEQDYETASVQLRGIIADNGQSDLLVEPHVLLARALVHMNRVDGAIEQLSIASKQDPTNVGIALQLATLLQSRGEFDRVQQELDRVTPFVRSSAQRAEVAQVADRFGQSDVAMKVLEGKGGPAGTSDDDRSRGEQLLRASMHRRRHEYAQAEAIVAPLLAKPDLATVQIAASVYMGEGKQSEADQTLKLLDGLKLEPGVKELTIGSVYVQSGQIDKAIPHYQAAAQQAPQNPAAWRAVVTSELAVGTADSVNAAVVAIDAAAAAVPADKAFAALHAQADAVRRAAGDPELRSAITSALRDPAVVNTSIDLMRMVTDVGRSLDRQHLLDQLQKLAEAQPTYVPAQLELIRCYASLGRTQEALAAAQRTMAAAPQDPAPAKLVVQIAQATGRWGDSMSAAEAWRRRDPDEAEEADVAIARAKLEQGGYEESLSTLAPYLAAATKDPARHYDFIGTYALALLKSNRIDDANKLLWPLAKAGGRWRVLWVQVGPQAIAERDKAAAWLDQLDALGASLDLGTRVALAEAYDRLGEATQDAALRRKATASFAELVKDPAASDIALLAAAAQAERVGDVAQAEQLYRHALDRNPRLAVAANNLAMLIIKRGGDPTEAVKLAAGAVTAAPGSATLRDTLAHAQLQAGDAKGAVGTMREAVKLEPENPRWRIRLTEYLYKAGDKVEAAKSLQQFDDSAANRGELSAQTQAELQAVREMVRGAKAG